jgi:hypothetical protein
MSKTRRRDKTPSVTVPPEPAGRVPPGASARPWLFVVTVLLVVPWLVTGAIYLNGATRERRTPVPPEAPTESPAGPWGRLTKSPIVIAPPAEYVPHNWGTPMPLLWHVPVTSSGELAPFFSAAGLGGADIARLQATARRESPGTGMVVAPDPAMVRALPPEVRARVYLQMSRAQGNRDQHTAFRFHGSSVHAWLGAAVSDETVAMLEPFIFRQRGFMYLADLDAVWPQIEDPAELQRLARALNRQATMLVTLHVDDAADVPALAAYWGRGGRRTDIRPLLDSLGDQGRAMSIDISHLLPALARDLLYRYPRLTVSDHEKPVLPNCLWTALNFFNGTPDDRFLDVQFAVDTLVRDYDVVRGEPALGDVVAFTDRDGNLFHVAVYVADGLVFGKNGIAPLSPWSLLPLERLEGHYIENSDGWHVTFHRRKDLI